MTEITISTTPVDPAGRARHSPRDGRTCGCGTSRRERGGSEVRRQRPDRERDRDSSRESIATLFGRSVTASIGARGWSFCARRHDFTLHSEMAPSIPATTKRKRATPAAKSKAKPAAAKSVSAKTAAEKPNKYFELRRSKIQGRGAFATRADQEGNSHHRVRRRAHLALRG